MFCWLLKLLIMFQSCFKFLSKKIYFESFWISSIIWTGVVVPIISLCRICLGVFELLRNTTGIFFSCFLRQSLAISIYQLQLLITHHGCYKYNLAIEWLNVYITVWMNYNNFLSQIFGDYKCGLYFLPRFLKI